MKIEKLGVPTTIGELKELINIYPNGTSFGFINQPLQMLEVVDDEYVVFQEIEETQTQIAKRERPILGFSCPVCNKVFAVSALHIDFFNENDHEENARIVKELIDYAAQGLNVKIYSGKDYDFDYCEHVKTRNK